MALSTFFQALNVFYSGPISNMIRAMNRVSILICKVPDLCLDPEFQRTQIY